MSTVLLNDDPLYEELYDIRREAINMGNLIDGDPYPGIAELRAQAPVHKGSLRSLLGLPHHERHAMGIGRDTYCTLSFAACEAAFRNPKALSSKIVHNMEAGDEHAHGLLEMDPPLHRGYRKTLQPMFVRSQTSSWWREKWVHEIVDALIARLRTTPSADLNIQYCARIPVHTITRAIGLDGEDALTFRQAILKSGAGGTAPPEVRREASATVQRTLLDLIDRRRSAPEDDIVSGLLAAELSLPDGTVRPLTDREIMFNTRIVMLAGGGTTWRQLGITIFALLSHPEQLAAAKADRALVDLAIEEAIRWNPTAPLFSRLAVEDVEIEGVTIPEGAVLEISLGAANRDPARFQNPDAFDLHRRTQGHQGFGMGVHQCLGMNVARSEMSIGINALLDAFPNIRLDPDAPEPYLTGGLEQRGVSGLPVRLD